MSKIQVSIFSFFYSFAVRSGLCQFQISFIPVSIIGLPSVTTIVCSCVPCLRLYKSNPGIHRSDMVLILFRNPKVFWLHSRLIVLLSYRVEHSFSFLLRCEQRLHLPFSSRLVTFPILLTYSFLSLFSFRKFSKKPFVRKYSHTKGFF